MAKTKTVSRGLRIPEEIDTWLRRAAAKAGQTRNEYAVAILEAAYGRRHGK